MKNEEVLFKDHRLKSIREAPMTEKKASNVNMKAQLNSPRVEFSSPLLRETHTGSTKAGATQFAFYSDPRDSLQATNIKANLGMDRVDEKPDIREFSPHQQKEFIENDFEKMLLR